MLIRIVVAELYQLDFFLINELIASDIRYQKLQTLVYYIQNRVSN